MASAARIRAAPLEGIGGSTMEERKIEARLGARVRRELGGLCLKFNSAGYTGVPDRVILLPHGRVIFAELKATGKKERPRQVYVQDVLRGLGFTVYSTVDSYEKVDRIIEELKRDGV